MPTFASRRGPAPSKFLPEELEKELRKGVLDAVVDGKLSEEARNAPQIIIGNPESGCHGTYLRNHHGTDFNFHHCKMKYATKCMCICEVEDMNAAYDIPEELNKYRLQLMKGDNLPYKLEPKLAAIVVMKTFLGMSVPQPLRWSGPDASDEEETTD